MGYASRRSLRYAAPAFFVITALLLIGKYAVQHKDETSAQNGSVAATASPSNTDVVLSDRWQALGKSNHFVTGLEQLPASLEGTDVPDGLHVDQQGNLIISTQLRDVFEYFLSSLGEEDLDTLVGRIRAYLANNLSGNARQQANNILDGYLAWRDNLATIEQAGGVSPNELDLEAVRAQKAEVQASCGRFLDATVCETFFAQQNLRDSYAIDRFTVLQDDSLSATEKAQRLAALNASLPAPMREQINDVTRQQELQALTQSLREEGGGSAELRTLREELVGAEAADRLEQLDQKRAQFKQRVDQWLNERESLLNNSGLSEADRDEQIQRLRTQRFSSEEVTRVETLERIADTKR